MLTIYIGPYFFSINEHMYSMKGTSYSGIWNGTESPTHVYTSLYSCNSGLSLKEGMWTIRTPLGLVFWSGTGVHQKSSSRALPHCRRNLNKITCSGSLDRLIFIESDSSSPKDRQTNLEFSTVVIKLLTVHYRLDIAIADIYHWICSVQTRTVCILVYFSSMKELPLLIQQ